MLVLPLCHRPGGGGISSACLEGSGGPSATGPDGASQLDTSGGASFTLADGSPTPSFAGRERALLLEVSDWYVSDAAGAEQDARRIRPIEQPTPPELYDLTRHDADLDEAADQLRTWLSSEGFGRYVEPMMAQGYGNLHRIVEIDDCALSELLGDLHMPRGHCHQFRRALRRLRSGFDWWLPRALTISQRNGVSTIATGDRDRPGATLASSEQTAPDVAIQTPRAVSVQGSAFGTPGFASRLEDSPVSPISVTSYQGIGAWRADEERTGSAEDNLWAPCFHSSSILVEGLTELSIPYGKLPRKTRKPRLSKGWPLPKPPPPGFGRD